MLIVHSFLTLYNINLNQTKYKILAKAYFKDPFTMIYILLNQYFFVSCPARYHTIPHGCYHTLNCFPISLPSNTQVLIGLSPVTQLPFCQRTIQPSQSRCYISTGGWESPSELAQPPPSPHPPPHHYLLSLMSCSLIYTGYFLLPLPQTHQTLLANQNNPTHID